MIPGCLFGWSVVVGLAGLIIGPVHRGGRSARRPCRVWPGPSGLFIGRSVGVGCLTGSSGSFVGLVRRGRGLVPLACYWLVYLVFVDRSVRVV
jgi:hypothetical protein